MHTTKIRRSEKNVSVWGEYDVAVAGGGIAGAAAALSAVRRGAKTCLIEKYSGLGGLATLGHVVVYLPLCDGNGRQICFGIAEEFLKVPMKYSLCKPPEAWQGVDSATKEERAGKRYQLTFDPASMAIGLERLLDEAGVDIIYDTLVVDVNTDDGGALTHLVVENKSGCGAFAVKTVIDCTGDADICKMCGEETETAAKNVRSAWYYAVDENRRLEMGYAVDEYWKVDEKPEIPRFDGTDWRGVTAQIIESRKLILEDLARLNRGRNEAGKAKLFPFYAPFLHGFRMTRHLVSDYVITSEDVHKWHDDAVGLFPDWRNRGPVYALPLRSILAVKTPNLAVAGRCISSAGDAWDVTRVIPVCAVSGEAAGISAALAAGSGRTLRQVQAVEVQEILKERGVVLDKALLDPVA